MSRLRKSLSLLAMMVAGCLEKAGLFVARDATKRPFPQPARPAMCKSSDVRRFMNPPHVCARKGVEVLAGYRPRYEGRGGPLAPRAAQRQSELERDRVAEEE